VAVGDEGQGAPRERRVTIRAALRAALEAEALTALELSARVRISEKEVATHLQHLERSLRRQGAWLEVQPASCLACGFSFRDRTRLTRPGACPSCRGTRIDPPVFRVRPPGGLASGPDAPSRKGLED
jgi:transcriptional regulator